MWMPTPSSRSNRLPMPSTSNRPSASVIAAATHELPSADHGGGGTTSFDVVVVEDQVYVHNCKQDEEPHHRMVPLAHLEVTTHERNNPGKHVGQKRAAHAGIERKPGGRLKQERQERQEIDEARQRVVPDRYVAANLRLQHIHLDNVADLLPLFTLVGEEVRPARVSVAGKPPVDTRKKHEEENEGRHKMGEADSAEPVLLVGL